MAIDKEFLDNEAQKLMDEEEKHIEDAVSAREDLIPGDEELKDLFLKQARIQFIARLFRDREDWKRNFYALTEFKVMKFPRIMQSLMYLLGFSREQVC